jgi:hypothetical protein
VHRGRIRVRGTAPNKLTWELGINRYGDPVMVIGPGEAVKPSLRSPLVKVTQPD